MTAGSASDAETAAAHGLRVLVAWACRILAMDGHTDLTLGHVSARGPAGRVYMKRHGLGLNEITPDDVLTIDLDCNKLHGKGKVHLEAVLHTEAYRARPDVAAVVHTHPPYATALSATTAKLEFVNHDAVLFYEGLGIFDDTAELITRPEQGQAVARALGSCRAALMRNHGVLVVGNSVPWAIFTAVTLERAARMQTIAAALGPLLPIPPKTVETMYPDKYRDDFIESYWQYMIREARRQGLGAGMPAEE